MTFSQVQDRFDHYIVQAVVVQIMKQADEYVHAINMSLETAQRGCEFADDAIELCNFVSQGGAQLDHLKRFLSDMLDKASTAHTQAVAMDQQFRRVRSSLFQVSFVGLL